MHIRQNGKFCKENKIMLDMTTLKTSSSQELTHHRTYMKVILRSSNTHMHSSTHTHTHKLMMMIMMKMTVMMMTTTTMMMTEDGRQTGIIMEAAGCEIIGGAPTSLWVEGQIDERQTEAGLQHIKLTTDHMALRVTER